MYLKKIINYKKINQQLVSFIKSSRIKKFKKYLNFKILIFNNINNVNTK